MVSVISSTILATIVFFFLLLPGFIFLRTFWGSDRGSLETDNIYKYVIWGTLISIIFYSISVFCENHILNKFLPAFPSEEVFGLILKKEPDTASIIAAKRKIIILFIVVDLLAWLIASLIRYLIFIFNLDVRFSFLRFKSELFYVLSGRELDKHLYPKGFYVEVDLLCSIGNSLIIYNGIVWDYKFKGNSLKYIYLKNANRKLMEELVSSTSFATSTVNNLNTYTAISTEDSINADGPITAEGAIQAKGSISAESITAKGTITSGGKITSKGAIIANYMMVTPPKTSTTAPPSTYYIPGDMMVFKEEEIKNLNVIYVKL